jgi:mono/diheme cytochrome c family protein
VGSAFAERPHLFDSPFADRRNPLRPLTGALALLFVAATMLATTPSPAAPSGEALFEDLCSPCHTIGGGDLVGPDLAGVHRRRSREWLLRFVRSSESLVRSGDPDATALYERYDETPMPDMDLSDDEIAAILDYVASASSGGADVQRSAAPEASALSSASPEDVERGAKLFQGFLRFENGGPSCLSCHHVDHPGSPGGGNLAKDLTRVFSRLGEKGVTAIVRNPPFPAMRVAYRDRPLTDREVFALTAFLKRVDESAPTGPGTNVALAMVLPGLGGLAVLLLLFGILWTRGKRSSVNQAVFARQDRPTRTNRDG